MNAGSVSITTSVSTVVALVSVFVTVKDISADKERSLMVMFGDTVRVPEGPSCENEMRSCPLVGPGCPDSAPTITTSSLWHPATESRANSRRNTTPIFIPLFFTALPPHKFERYLLCSLYHDMA